MSIEEHTVIDIDIDHPTPKESVLTDVKLVNNDEDIVVDQDGKQDDYNEIELLSEDLLEEDNDEDMDERIGEDDFSKTEQLDVEELGEAPVPVTNTDLDMDDHHNDTTVYYEALNTTHAESPIDYVSPEKVNEDETNNDDNPIEINGTNADEKVEEEGENQENITLNEEDDDQTQDNTGSAEIDGNNEDILANKSMEGEEHDLSNETQDHYHLDASKAEIANDGDGDDQQAPAEEIKETEDSKADEDDPLQNDQKEEQGTDRLIEEAVDHYESSVADQNEESEVIEDNEDSLQQKPEAEANTQVEEESTNIEEQGDNESEKAVDGAEDQGEEENLQNKDTEEKENQEVAAVESNEKLIENIEQPEEKQATEEDYPSSTSSQNVEYCPIPILLRTNVFPYLLCPVSPETHKKLSPELDSVISLFDDSSVLQFTLTQILNQVKEIFNENDNPFDEDEELILTFQDFGGTSIEETSVLADTLYVYDIIEMFQLVMDNADDGSKPECLYIDLSSRKSFRSQMTKIWALKNQIKEAVKGHLEGGDVGDDSTTDPLNRDYTVDFELSEDEPEDEDSGKNEQDDDSPANLVKRPINVLESDDNDTETSQKRHKEEQ